MSKYVQIARKLRVQRGPGRPDLVSERPGKWVGRGGDNERYVFSDTESPTLIEFDEHCRVDVASMLAKGSIRYEDPTTKGAGRVKSRRS